MQRKENDRFPADRLRLKQIFTGTSMKQCTESLLDCPKVKEVYGPLLFPPLPRERSYTFGSFVASIDGRIAYPESPDGTLIAKSNSLDPDGGLCDFWILNLLRAACDAVIMGSLTIKREPELTGRIFDPPLQEQRRKEGRGDVPLHVIVSRGGRNLPEDHKIFTRPEIPALIALSPDGAAALVKRAPHRYTPIDSPAELKATLQAPREGERNPRGGERNLRSGEGKTPLVGIGTGADLDPVSLLTFLRRAGFGRSLVETPTFLASLMAADALDELYLNTSAIFVGGKALTIGENAEPFTVARHPEASVLSIHSHSDSFFYTRYRFTGPGSI